MRSLVWPGGRGMMKLMSQLLDYRSPQARARRNWLAWVWLAVGVALLVPYGVFRNRLFLVCEHADMDGYRVYAGRWHLELIAWRQERLPPRTPYRPPRGLTGKEWSRWYPTFLHRTNPPMGAVPATVPVYAPSQEHSYFLWMPWYVLALPPLLLALRSWRRGQTVGGDNDPPSTPPVT